MSKLIAYLAVAVTLFVIDMVWLQLIAKSWYQEGMGHLMAARPNLVAAALFYLLYPAGLVLFAVLPATGGDGILKASMWGALFGLFAYGTYDLTNMAILKDWPIGLSIIDIVWGGIVGGVAAAAGKAAADAMG
jgi:uncharacterized membrane protein